MNKGMLLSTSGFQSGAIKYAKEHGIALIQVYDHSCVPVSHSGGPNMGTDDSDPFTYCENHWPKYEAICYSPDSEEPMVVYPTREIIKNCVC